MELVAPGDRVRTVGGRLNGSQNGLSILGPIGFPDTFSLLITLKVQPKVSELIFICLKSIYNRVSFKRSDNNVGT